MKGFVHVYTGNGKGKTTSAVGLAIRASGHKKRVFIAQFMKGVQYGENLYLANSSHIDIEQFGWDKCISKDEVNEAHRKITEEGILKCREIMASRRYDVMILDEVLIAIWFGLISENKVLDFIENKPEELELILTGRHATDSIVEKADLVTEMNSIKHYYDKGITSRQGIDC